MRSVVGLGVLVVTMGCSASASDPVAISGAGGSTATDAGQKPDASKGSGGALAFDAAAPSAHDGNGHFVGDPSTCAEAAASKSYVGCDFWPTVTANAVWPIFDFAVVVANTQSVPAEVVIERAGKTIATGSVGSNGLEKFYLPWIDELKGPAVNSCGYLNEVLTSSVRSPDGAYHLTSSVPVTVYQFSALEYRGVGGPSNKDWSSCPAHSCPGGLSGCLSYSNDASLLLPSTALTGNYRVPGMKGWPGGPVPPFFAVTGTEDETTVKVDLAPGATVSAGGGLATYAAGSVFEFSLGRGEVVELVGTSSTDLSGTLVQASAPVQVVFGMACVYLPFGQKACDHLEESAFPAETLGKRYFVTPPTGPNGNVPGHIVRLFGNVDGTKLTYAPVRPNGAPDLIAAGETVDIDVVTESFEVTGDHEFAVASFQLGSTVVDPGVDPMLQRGDPSASLTTAVEQYRKKYVFLAPDDYDVNYVDVVLPAGAKVVLDGAPMAVNAAPIASGFSVARVKLGPGNAGAHVLESDQPVGIQVMGYGAQTSYQYAGGSNLLAIAPPPPPIK